MNDAGPSAFADVPGTTRVCSPRETIDRVSPLLPVFGITRVANVTGLDRIGIPVVMVTRPNARSISVSQGKGATLDAAKASGLMEAIEIHHAEHILAPLLLSSYDEIRFRETVADVAAMALSVRRDLTSAARLLWICGTDLATGSPVWVPHEAVHTDFRTPFPEGSGYFLCTSNGLASGNQLEEAVTHGLCEVIERDSMALWRFRDQADRDATEVDLDSVRDGHCRALIDRFAAAGATIRVWNVTSDLGVPAFHAWVSAPDLGVRLAVGGFKGHGCHPFAEIALSRALTEAAQGRLTMIAGVRDDIDATAYDERPDTENEEGTARDGAAPPVDFAEVASLPGVSPRALIEGMTERLAAAGMEQVIVVDLTRPEFEIPVVRVIVPGLEGNSFARLYRPGRRAARVAGAGR